MLERLQKMPTLLLHGKTDRTVPLVHAERLHAALPGSRLVEPDDGHYAIIHRGLPVLEEYLRAI